MPCGDGSTGTTSGVRIKRSAIPARANIGRHNFNVWLDRGGALHTLTRRSRPPRAVGPNWDRHSAPEMRHLTQERIRRSPVIYRCHFEFELTPSLLVITRTFARVSIHHTRL